MSKPDIIRAWKDEEYRNSLSGEELALLPEHPSGEVELNQDQLDQVAGGSYTYQLFFTISCCEFTINIVGCYVVSALTACY